MSKSILEGKTCFITGASGGLGYRIATEMARNGCNLILTSRDYAKLSMKVTTLKSAFGHKITIDSEVCDFVSLTDTQRLLRNMKDYAIDILVNCAGVYITKPLLESGLGDYSALFDINVRAAFMLSHAFATGMVERKWGRIINIGSSSSYEGRWDSPLYCASKHALLGLSRAMHEDLRRYNVRVFCVSPGAVKTPMGDHIAGDKTSTFIKPEEIAKYIAQIISFDSTMVSEEVKLNRMQFPHH